MPRQYTRDEVREQFLKTVASYAKYWENESRAVTTREKLEGLAFGILVILDGGCPDIPGFLVVPNPNEEDKDYLIGEGKTIFPFPSRSRMYGPTTLVVDSTKESTSFFRPALDSHP